MSAKQWKRARRAVRKRYGARVVRDIISRTPVPRTPSWWLRALGVLFPAVLAWHERREAARREAYAKGAERYRRKCMKHLGHEAYGGAHR